jgi:hypothetical protein
MGTNKKFDAVMEKKIDLYDHYRNWSFEAILVDATLILSEKFKERTPEIIRWANDVPMNRAAHLKKAGIAIAPVDEVATHHLAAAITQYNQSRHRLIEVMVTYFAYQGREEKKHGK